MKKYYKIFSVFIICNLWSMHSANEKQIISKEFLPSGQIESLVDSYSEGPYSLIQLDLKNDSLLSIINNLLPSGEMYSPASYHRIVTDNQLNIITQNLDESNYFIINYNYQLPNASTRLYWVDVEPGSNTYGTYSDDDAIEYTCSCLSGTSDCVKLGWDDGWYNPFDYWGEAWYAFDPPLYQSIQEIRITVTGAQCDALPVWSETYMGMRDQSGNWSQDYQLSIDYTDNAFIINPIWSDGMLMPQIGSEDNYVIDKMRIDFYYTCDSPEESPSNFVASDEVDCSFIDISWNLSPSEYSEQKLYRDGELLSTLSSDQTTFQDWLATPGVSHNYCINVENECGQSEQICNEGSLKSVSDPIAGVESSDGSYLDRVVTTWDPTEDAHTYKIYRDGTWLGVYTNGETEYIDFYVVLDEEYEYCIEAINDCGNSDWSCDIGYSSTQPGDLNEDMIINVIDIVIVVNIILGVEEATEYSLWSADLNQDSTINIQDVILLVNLIIN